MSQELTVARSMLNHRGVGLAAAETNEAPIAIVVPELSAPKKIGQERPPHSLIRRVSE